MKGGNMWGDHPRRFNTPRAPSGPERIYWAQGLPSIRGQTGNCVQFRVTGLRSWLVFSHRFAEAQILLIFDGCGAHVAPIWLPFDVIVHTNVRIYCIAFSSIDLASILHWFWFGFQMFFIVFAHKYQSSTKPRKSCFWTTLLCSALKTTFLQFQKKHFCSWYHICFCSYFVHWFVLVMS